ncbi:hypothetical protein [Streptomyces sp. NPDC007856]|uniref:hypothetical protein n=1 Tax=Streptomyces sp. NPDC007856 TaxID=3364781 RepID=UPI00368CFCEC
MKYVVFYESADDLDEKAPARFAAHVARYQPFVERGELLMTGPFANPRERARWPSSARARRPRSSSPVTRSSCTEW